MNPTEQAAQTLRNSHLARDPVHGGQGYWAGAPGVFYARDERAFYVTYRLRRRGVPDRGGEARIARSVDLQQFEDVWSVNKDVYRERVNERSAIAKGADGIWRYFTSSSTPATDDGVWRWSADRAR